METHLSLLITMTSKESDSTVKEDVFIAPWKNFTETVKTFWCFQETASQRARRTAKWVCFQNDFTEPSRAESHQCTGDCWWRRANVISDFCSAQSTQTERKGLEGSCYSMSQSAPQSPITSRCLPISASGGAAGIGEDQTSVWIWGETAHDTTTYTNLLSETVRKVWLSMKRLSRANDGMVGCTQG